MEEIYKQKFTFGDNRSKVYNMDTSDVYLLGLVSLYYNKKKFIFLTS